MISSAAFLEEDIVRAKYRPPCPHRGCRLRTWPTFGLEDETVYLCLAHGWWIPVELEDAEGTPLPLLRWTRYLWRFA